MTYIISTDKGLTREWLISFGFEPLAHFNVGNALIKSIGRNRIISISCVGTPNEMISLCERNATDARKIDDIIILRNYDYDGYTTEEQCKQLYESLMFVTPKAVENKMENNEDLAALVKRIWARAYLDSVEQHMELIKEFKLEKSSATENSAQVESQEDLDENILDVILIAKVNSKEEAKALISRQFTITRKQHGTD